MMKSVNINADLGEGAGNDAQVMPFIHSCNIACGGHAGNENTVRETILLAQKHGVKIGAHPGYADKKNFGRVSLDINFVTLQESIRHQLETFFRICEEGNAEVHHIKLHGALYNDTAKNKELAGFVLDVFQSLNFKGKLYVPHNSAIHQLADNKFKLCFEAFIDRVYEEDGTLRSRSKEGALHQTPQKVWSQLSQMVKNKTVTTYGGKVISVQANTYCIHGDHPNAVNILQYLSKKMKAEDFN